MVELDHPHWGKVRLRRWDDKHARQDADASFSVILVEAHLERERPSKPFWLGYQPPPHQQAQDQPLETVWQWYEYRWPVEPAFISASNTSTGHYPASRDWHPGCTTTDARKVARVAHRSPSK